MSLSDRTHLGFLYGHFLNEGHWKLMVFQISWFLFLCTTQIWWFGMVFTCHVVESHQIDILWRQKRNQWNSLQECLASVETPDRKRRTGCPSWTCANNIIFIYIYIYIFIWYWNDVIHPYTIIYLYIYTYTAILFWSIKGIDMHILGQAIYWQTCAQTYTKIILYFWSITCSWNMLFQDLPLRTQVSLSLDPHRYFVFGEVVAT